MKIDRTGENYTKIENCWFFLTFSSNTFHDYFTKKTRTCLVCPTSNPEKKSIFVIWVNWPFKVSANTNREALKGIAVGWKSTWYWHLLSRQDLPWDTPQMKPEPLHSVCFLSRETPSLQTALSTNQQTEHPAIRKKFNTQNMSTVSAQTCCKHFLSVVCSHGATLSKTTPPPKNTLHILCP